MKISSLYSIKPLRTVPKWLPILIAVFSFLGFLDASYLVAEHYLGLPLPCGILQGCEQVTNSPYSVFAGVPVALFGAVYYLTFFILAVAYFDSGRAKILSFLARFSVLGFLASLYFLYLQLFVIGAVCIYCLGSLATSALLFILGVMVVKLENAKPLTWI